jgi:predicted TIM-barrel enzyme
MWWLYVTIAMAPAFDPVSKSAQYLTEQDCQRALSVAIQRVADDGVVIIGRCTRETGRPAAVPRQPKPQ